MCVCGGGGGGCLKVKVKISVSSDDEETLKYPYVQIQIENNTTLKARLMPRKTEILPQVLNVIMLYIHNIHQNKSEAPQFSELNIYIFNTARITPMTSSYTAKQ